MRNLFFSLFVIFMLTETSFAQALLVGVKDNGTFEPLQYAPNDVYRLSNVLAEHGYNVTTMLDAYSEKPTRANILREWKTICENTPYDKCAIFYGSLHGTEIDGNAYIVPVDGDIDQPNETMIHFRELWDIAKRKKIKKCLVVLDCCQDGVDNYRTIRFKSVGRWRQPQPQEIKRKSLTPISAQSAADAIAGMPENYWVIFSCRPGERSVEDSKLRGSVFTHFFANAFDKREAANEKGELTVNTVFYYVRSQVESYCERINVVQVPRIYGESSSDEMVIATLKNYKQDTNVNSNFLPSPSARKVPQPEPHASQGQPNYQGRVPQQSRPLVQFANSPAGRSLIGWGLGQIR